MYIAKIRAKNFNTTIYCEHNFGILLWNIYMMIISTEYFLRIFLYRKCKRHC